MNRSEQLQRPGKDVLKFSPITRGLTESPISRKRSIWDIEETLQPKLCLQAPAHTHLNKRSRESSFEESPSSPPTTFLTPCTNIASPSYSYGSTSSSPNSYCIPTMDYGHTSYRQEAVSGDKRPPAPTLIEPLSFSQDSSHVNSPMEISGTPMLVDSDEDTHMGGVTVDEPDICFGMIQDSTIASSANHDRTALTPLTLRCHSSLKTAIVYLESGQYLGLLDAHTAAGINNLLERHRVRLQAFIPPRSKKIRKPVGDNLSIFINVYGSESLFEAIGDILSNNTIFLQHPQHKEPHVQYKNPHFLTIPSRASNLATVQIPDQVMNEVTTLFEQVEHRQIPQVEPSRWVKTPLLRHQKEALSFMVEKEAEIRSADISASSNILPNSYGGILADQMGLGKSLTTLALITSTMTLSEAFGRSTINPVQAHPILHVKTTLLITPKSTLGSWQEEINMHIEASKLKVYIYHGPKREMDPKRLATFDIVMTTYATVSNEFFPNARAKARGTPLKDILWFRVVLDEAHIIRERSTQQSRAVFSLEAKNRWCLTGTPIQNKISDLGSLVRFLRVRPYDDNAAFTRLIVNPLKLADPDGLQNLRKLICSVAIRRTKKILGLPPRTDQVQYVEFSTSERQVYEACTRDSTTLIEAALVGSPTGNGCFGIVQSFLRLRLVCDHGKELLPKDVNHRIEEYNKLRGHAGSVQGDRSIQSEGLFGDTGPAVCEFCDHPIKNGNSCAEMSISCLHVVCSECLLRHQAPSKKQDDQEVLQLLCPICEETEDSPNPQDDTHSGAKWMEGLNYSGPSTKVKSLLEKLRASEMEGSNEPIKSVVFSYWTKMLDLIGHALNMEGMRYVRLDGSMNLQKREEAVASFRQDPSVNIILISIGSGSVGLNLTVACRVHLLEPQWNPMAEQQALDRVHRIGQTREVITTRYIMKDSFEESVLAFQQRKLALVDLSLSSKTKAEGLRERLKELRGLFK